MIFQFLFFFIDSLMRNAQADVGWVNRLISASDAGQIKYVLVGLGLIVLARLPPAGHPRRP